MRKINDPDALKRYMDAHRLSGLFDRKTERAMELFSFDRGEIICSSGDQLMHLFLLVEGRIKVYKVLPNGKSILIRFYNPLSTIGDLEMLSDIPARSTVESVNETCFIGISRQAMADTANEDPAFLRFIVKQLANKLDTFSNASSLNLLYPVETRFASYLVSITSDENGREQIEELKTSKLTEIAELLGTSYRHLNRVITQFARDGLVERKRGALFIKDLDRLRALSNGNLYS
ncbi:Crp/Fnr family transcriptional regulator [Cohnella yongneupensis]|uniref:Crp/Fnr family transcriptional regulator n=1 Tax=Cohnella yongneupensis TaxID=425006 RepID=A0ABW0R3A1_9BACL